MIYMIFAITAIINIFNILLISNNNIIQDKKEKVLLVTYSIAELIYILFFLTTIQYTAVNTVIVLSFVIVWLLSKSYILVVNMNFNDNEEVIAMENSFAKEISTKEEIIEEVLNEETEVISEVPEDKVDIVEDNNVEEENTQTEKIELSDLVEKAKEKIFTPTSLHQLSDIVESAKINKEEEIRMRRRSLALRASKIMNDEQ